MRVVSCRVTTQSASVGGQWKVRPSDQLIAGGNVRWQASAVSQSPKGHRGNDGSPGSGAPGSPRTGTRPPPNAAVVAAAAAVQQHSAGGASYTSRNRDARIQSPRSQRRAGSATTRPPVRSATRPQSSGVKSSLAASAHQMAARGPSATTDVVKAAYTLPPDFPHDRIHVTSSPILAGVPVVIRSPEERAVNPERLNLDKLEFERCPILEQEYSLRLLNFQVKTCFSLSFDGFLFVTLSLLCELFRMPHCLLKCCFSLVCMVIRPNTHTHIHMHGRLHGSTWRPSSTTRSARLST